ncbi:MAG: cysteine desulfurase [Patescibacteria group bacterium]|nr:MAG: cysteine desulfurase [Patescibacteria group bacterium]
MQDMKYLDYAATSPVDPLVFERMLPYFKSEFGNASSAHSLGRQARMAVERARNEVALALGVAQSQILFTGSASEANNLALKGVVESLLVKHPNRNFELIVSQIEHPCVIESAKHLESLGWAKVHWLEVDSVGQVNLEQLESALNEKTVLVSVMYVNNEIGSVQPIAKIKQLVDQGRRRRKEVDSLPIFFHCDSVQALQYYPIKGIADFITLAPHKYYGPKGVGILVKPLNVELKRQVDGGGQEYYLRAGTENVAGIVGAGLATVIAVREGEAARNRVMSLRDELVRSLNAANLGGILVSDGDIEMFSPHIVNIIFPELDGEILIAALDQRGFAVSSGSACSSGVVRKSHVLEALNLGLDKYAPLRISIDKSTTTAELQEFVHELKSCIVSLSRLGI